MIPSINSSKSTSDELLGRFQSLDEKLSSVETQTQKLSQQVSALAKDTHVLGQQTRDISARSESVLERSREASARSETVLEKSQEVRDLGKKIWDNRVGQLREFSKFVIGCACPVENSDKIFSLISRGQQ